jgi:O-antigen ligase/polysaccharide polymerase Wzy-like membrane protein
MIDFTLALALFLSVATNLRIFDLPVGPSEVLMILLSFSIFYKVLKNVGYKELIIKIKPVLYFWFTLFASILLGVFMSKFLNLPEGSIVLHSTVGYCYAAFISLLIYTRLCFFSDSAEKIVKYLIYISVPILLLAYSIEISIKHFGLSADWYQNLRLTSYHNGTRFSAWSKNPNQLALLFCLLPFLAIRQITKENKVVFALFITLIFWMGWHIRSDALSSAVEIIAVLYLFMFIANLSFRKKTNYFLLYPFLVLLTGTIFYIFADEIFNKPGKNSKFMSGILYSRVASGIINKIESQNSVVNNIEIKQRKVQVDVNKKTSGGAEGKINARLFLYKNSIKVWRQSPIFGFGPGAYSGIEAPFMGMESHNTYLDLLTNAGIVGVLIFFVFIGKIAYLTWLKKDFHGLFALTALLMFSSAHLTLRHPLFWFVLILLYATSRISTTSPK